MANDEIPKAKGIKYVTTNAHDATKPVRQTVHCREVDDRKLPAFPFRPFLDLAERQSRFPYDAADDADGGCFDGGFPKRWMVLSLK